ncbi:hypothetical protein DL93DRAFT_2173031 [Clavulina sp. PMI_390]|nr:hypothetical protein DL93DRAFT_2173031 [Clavulina sp. PMI_390]
MSTAGSGSDEPQQPTSTLANTNPESTQPTNEFLEWSSANATFGPNNWAATREKWLRGERRGFGASGGLAPKTSSRSVQNSDALRKLDEILDAPGVDENLSIWDGYLKDVHGRLVGGNKVKKGMRLTQAVKILRIGWKRDGTWYGEEQPQTRSRPPDVPNPPGRYPPAPRYGSSPAPWNGSTLSGAGSSTNSSTLPVLR